MTAAITPLWFGSAAAPIAGRLHAPATPARDLSVVVCGPPFGWEDVCAYRSLRTLAKMLAAAGFTTLRFDFPGTGDSADGDGVAGRWHAWVDAVGGAVEVVRAQGPERCVLIGVGLGGAVAISAVDEGLAVDGLVLWDAVLAGRTWLRQARAFQRLAARERLSAPIFAAGEGEELAGFVLGSPLRDDLEALDLRTPPSPVPAAWAGTFVVSSLARGDRSAPATALAARGATVEEAVFGSIEPMLDEPHRAAPVTAGFRAICDLLVARSTGWVRSGPEPERSAAAVPSAGVRERVLTLQEPGQPNLWAVESRPDLQEAASDRWFVFLNAAGVRHIGPNRMWVRFARTLAGGGICSLRVDVRGVGDGGGDEVLGDTIAAYYDPILWSDVDRLADHARSLGARSLVMVGLCSGATAAFQAACRRDDVRSVVMLNPLLLDWDEQAASASEADSTWRSAIRPGHWLRGSRWRKVFSGQVPLRSVVRGLGARVRPDRGSAAGPAEQLRSLARGGVDVHLIVARDDASADFITRLAGGDLDSLAVPGLDVRMLTGPDHTFRPMTSQAELYRIIEEVAERAV